VFGDENVVQDQRAASGAAQAQDVPVVDDLDVVHRHEHVTDGFVAGRVLRLGADDGPLGVAAAGGEREPA
jgi:hypothetical protein